MELTKSKVTVKIGDYIATEFGTGIVQAISDEYVIVDVSNEDEVCIDKHSGLLSVPVNLTGVDSVAKYPTVVGVGDEVAVDDYLVGIIKVITKDYVIVKNDKGESPVFIKDARFFLPYEVEFE